MEWERMEGAKLVGRALSPCVRFHRESDLHRQLRSTFAAAAIATSTKSTITTDPTSRTASAASAAAAGAWRLHGRGGAI